MENANIFEKELEKKSIFLDRNAISPHFIPRELPFREKQIQEITQSLAVALKNQKPDNLFIYGKTGTGKTASTKFVLEQFLEFKEKKSAKVNATYINCRTHNGKYKVLIKIVKEFLPNENLIGYSFGFVFDKLLGYLNENEVNAIVALDEIDKVKELDELVYSLTRLNDETKNGSISIIGISNNLMFKDKLDQRTKSSLCKKEMIFPPYNASELKEILKKRINLAFKESIVEENAINLAAAIAAKESGDARTALLLLLRAGEIVEENGLKKLTDKEIQSAKSKVEEEIIFNMISTLPEQEQLVLKAVAELSMQNKGFKKINGSKEEGILFSGEIYDYYLKLAKQFKEHSVSSRWFREYINELEMYGLILTTQSGKGIKGQTRLIKLGFDAGKINEVIEKELKGE